MKLLTRWLARRREGQLRSDIAAAASDIKWLEWMKRHQKDAAQGYGAAELDLTHCPLDVQQAMFNSAVAMLELRIHRKLGVVPE